MMYELLKYAHIVGATVLFGTGLGIAFFLFVAVRSGNVETIAGVLRAVVVGDFVFTAPSVVLQPVTGFALVWVAGYSLTDTWIWLSLVLYGLVGVCWLPVVAVQIKMKDIVNAAVEAGATVLPADFNRLYRIWFALGWPAFTGVLAIVALMIWKP
jgi:uncharacterized membrane protein